MVIPANFQLFGPAQTNASALTQITGAPQFVGIALTGSTHPFHFEQGMPSARIAVLRVLWASRNTANYVQLVAFDDGPSNVVEIARIQGNGSMSPANQGIVFTDAFNALVTAGNFKHLGFRIGGDGVNQWTLYEVQLEINFNLP